MSWGAVAGAAVSVIGSSMMSDGASQASGAQQAGATEQIAESRRQFDAVRKLLSPYVNTGTDALNQQRQLLGLGGLGSSASASPFQSRDQLRQQLLSQFTIPGSSGGAPREGDPGYIPGDYVMRNGQWGTWMTQGDQSPYWYSPGGGTAATGSSIDEVGLNSAIEQAYAGQGPAPSGLSADQEQAAAVSKFENSPYFQAITRQSEDAMLQNASATGGLRGGNIQDALSKNRPILLQSLIDKQLANLSGLSTSGQNAAAGVGTAAMNTGSAVNNAIGAGAAAQAGGILGQSNANISALGNIGGLFANKFSGSNSLFAPAVTDGGYSIGQGSAYGGTRSGL
jgi:hypothetical protein